MNITILQGAFFPIPPQLGGAVEKMWYVLGKEFARKGHNVLHVSREFIGFPNEETIENVTYKRIQGYEVPASIMKLKWFDLIYTWKARKAISEPCDVIITNTFWAPIILPRRLHRKCFIDVARMPKGQMKWYADSGRLRANSTVVAEAIKKEIHVKYHNKITLIPNPLPFKPNVQIDFHIKQNQILYVGRLHPEKGIEDLIMAFNDITNKDWKLKIVGPWDISVGGGGKSYYDLLARLISNENIELVGPIYQTDALNELYEISSIFVYPSLAENGETFGLAPLEAMAWGCVPIVSDLECFKDFISHSYNGIVYDHRNSLKIESLKNAIKELMINISEREIMAARASLVSITHSTTSIAESFLKEFELLKEQNEFQGQ